MLRPLGTLLCATALLLTGCTSESPAEEQGLTPEEVLAGAKQALDETSGVRLTLTTDALPEGVSGVTRAEGVGTHAPAFDGTLSVVLGAASFDVPVVALDGVVHAQLPLVPGWQEVDPDEYGAPDPAQLMSTDSGFSSLLTASEGVEEGESVRGGEDNAEVLTEYTATVSADTVGNVIPSAEGDFDATYTVTADGELREAVLTGVFYPNSESMTYTIGFEDYGTEKQITAP
jgi:lipoprotein LprG